MLKEQLRTVRVARFLKDVWLRHTSQATSPIKTLVKYCEELQIEDVLDVGANVGQFGIDLRRNGFSGRIFSFEPVFDTFKKLTRISDRDKKWFSHNIGIGDEEGTAKIFVSGNSGLSSSILEMTELHKVNFPASIYSSTEDIEMSSLVIQIPKVGISPKNTLLKIDVQGFEAHVLSGASNYIGIIPLIFFESSIHELYETEVTLLTLLNFLSTRGYSVVEIFRGAHSKEGKLLQVDVLMSLNSI